MIKIVCLCGSSKFVELFAVIKWLIEKEEHKIAIGLHLLPNWYITKCEDHLAEHENCAEQMDKLHRKKIDIADEIFIVNYNDYIGESTQKEIQYAKKLNKKFRWLCYDKIGKIALKILNNAISKSK